MGGRGGRGGAPTHLGLTRSFANLLGGAPGATKLLPPGAKLRGAGRRRTGDAAGHGILAAAAAASDSNLHIR